MSATDYHHGVRVIEISEGTRPIRTVSTAVYSNRDGDSGGENGSGGRCAYRVIHPQ
ncbi:hypothetical protein SM886_004055 [Yersinia enterocolitica]|nr:hypothetical protein [Yersinia enterocolitica]